MRIDATQEPLLFVWTFYPITGGRRGHLSTYHTVALTASASLMLVWVRELNAQSATPFLLVVRLQLQAACIVVLRTIRRLQGLS